MYARVSQLQNHFIFNTNNAGIKKALLKNKIKKGTFSSMLREFGTDERG